MLDVSFGEDASMRHKNHAPENLSLLRKIALNLIRADKSDACELGAPAQECDVG